MAHILGILCAPTAEKSVAYGLLRKALQAAEEAGTSSELEILRPDFSIKAVQRKLHEADGLIIATCNEDGANQAIAGIAMPLNHIGLYVPPFGTLIHNTAMPGHGEGGWQNKPEIIGRQVAEYALES